VLDIKYGSGAFLSDPARGAELGRTMLRLADGMGLSAAAWQTAMDRPLGAAVGHALEIAESIDCLAGEGPDDLRELVCLFGGQMLELAGSAATPEEGRERIAEALDQGRALGVLELVVTEQGGDPRCLADRTLLPHTDSVDPFTAAASGTLAFADVREVGRAVVALGGGRSSVEDEIDPAVGLVWRKRAGETVQRGDVLCEVHHRDGHGLDEARAHLARALAFDATAAAPGPLVLARVEP
jgi:thymidine phosphorylase